MPPAGIPIAAACASAATSALACMEARVGVG